MAGELAPLQSSIPIVVNNADRETRYPPASRIQNQRVQNLATGTIQRWVGSAWVDDFASIANSGTNMNVFNVRAAPFNATGNGTTDDTAAITAAITAANAAGGGIVLVPADMTCLITGSGLSVPSGVDFIMNATAVLQYTGTGVCLTLNQCVGGSYDLSVSRTPIQWHDNATDTSSEGVRIRNCTFSYINLRSAVGFWKGVNFYGDSASVGTQGVTLRLGYTDSCKLGIAATAVSGGFCNQVTIIGGNTILESTDLVSGSPVAGSKFVDLSTAGNGWTFLGVDFQGSNCEQNVVVLGVAHCFVNCRWESVRKVNFLSGSYDNQVIGGYFNQGYFDGTVWVDAANSNSLIGGYPAGGSTSSGYGTVSGGNSVPAQTLRGTTGNATLVQEIRDASNTVALRTQSDAKALAYPSAGSTYPTNEYDFRNGIFYTGSGTATPNAVFSLAGETAFNVMNFGAVGNGIVDDTAAIQAAITAAEAFIPTINVYLPQSPVVVLPSGIYKTTATLTITSPIRVMGHGAQQTMLVPSSANVPCFTINLTTAQSTYIVFELDHFGIVGKNPYNTYTTQDAADGIYVTATANVTAHIHDVRIVSMTGHGINLANYGNSHRIIDSVIEQCCKDGIHVDGSYNTNFWIQRNIIRENRRGIAVQNTTGLGTGYLSTGRIFDNLIESNNGGTTGTIGSADRPSIGVYLSKAQWVDCAGNYSENQWNDWFLHDNVSFCTFRENTFLILNSLSLVQTYGGPPVNQAGFYVGTGANSYNNVIGNVFGVQPSRQSGTTTTNWGTGTFGDTYPHVTDTVGVSRYLYNITQSPGNGTVQVTNPANRHTILNAEVDTTDGSGRAIQYLRAYKSQEDYANMSFMRTANQRLTFNLTNGNYLDTIQFIDNNVGRRAFLQVQAGPSGALANHHTLNPLGLLAQLWTDGASFQGQWSYGSAAPTTGTHAVGEIVWQSAPTSGGFIGFVCTTAGTPGTWKTFGVIS